TKPEQSAISSSTKPEQSAISSSTKPEQSAISSSTKPEQSAISSSTKPEQSAISSSTRPEQSASFHLTAGACRSPQHPSARIRPGDGGSDWRLHERALRREVHPPRLRVAGSLERDSSSGRINFKVSVTPADGCGKPSQQVVQCDTVLFAIGRAPVFSQLGLESAGVSLSKSWSTTCESIYAIGDAAEGRPQLTPAAIQAGRMLARRLYGGSAENCDYTGVPTTYSCCGLSEDAAMEEVRQRRRHCLSQEFQSAGWTVPHRARECLLHEAGVPPRPGQEGREPILGMHYLGPNGRR
uniref:Pyr_redox_2 domain-containing protein n=1 Tax=Macrostomum lignano TaxID=282301 RepID=A0A1I8FB89_9PLAT